LRQHPKWGDRVTELVSRWKDAAIAESKRKIAENGNENPELEEDMVSPKKVTIVGSGNWGSAIAR
jgi:hypothetical protein